MYFRHRPSFKDPVNNPFDVTCVLNLVVLAHFKSSDWFLFEIEQWSEMVYHRRNPLRMIKHTQTIRWLLPTNCLSVIGHFVGLAPKWLTKTCFYYPFFLIPDFY